MKKKAVFIATLCSFSSLFSCNKAQDKTQNDEFVFQSHLDSLKNGQIDYGNKEINQSSINLLNFQKKYKTGESNGVVIPKTLLTQSINGFTNQEINLPLDQSNYEKWDFLVVYPGLAINDQGEEKPEPCVFFYKGGLDKDGNLIPVGKPIKDIKFRGGGGGGGDTNRTTPPPTVP